jgi:hypothetical protein
MTTTAPLGAVVERMEAVIAPLAHGDGVACFTRLYLAVTRGVQLRLARVSFADPAFVERLDENFASLFFQALQSPPSAWRPLIDARHQKRVAPIQFALAGMNAHINRDLPVALVTTCTELGVELTDTGAEHRDYIAVNDALAQVEREVKTQYLDTRFRILSRLLRAERLEDVVAMWDVRRARDAAWVNGEALWALRGDAQLAARFLATLDRSVGLAAGCSCPRTASPDASRGASGSRSRRRAGRARRSSPARRRPAPSARPTCSARQRRPSRGRALPGTHRPRCR